MTKSRQKNDDLFCRLFVLWDAGSPTCTTLLKLKKYFKIFHCILVGFFPSQVEFNLLVFSTIFSPRA